MIYLKTEDEIELLRQANLLVSATLAEIAKVIRPGVTTNQLDTLAETFIRDHGAEPIFKGFPNPYGSDFPASICASVNEVVVHGIPNDVPLKEGDIVSVDCGAKLNGFCGDSCYTFAVGEISEEARGQIDRLLKQSFRPEFLNRLDEVVCYKPLTKENITSIVDLLLAGLNRRLEDKQLKVELTEAAKTFVIDNGYDPLYGARPLRRYLQHSVETLAARKMIADEVQPGTTLVVDCDGDQLVIR